MALKDTRVSLYRCDSGENRSGNHLEFSRINVQLMLM